MELLMIAGFYIADRIQARRVHKELRHPTKCEQRLYDALPECAVCMERPVAAVLGACGHAVCCAECTERVAASKNPACPSCRSPIQGTGGRAAVLWLAYTRTHCSGCTAPVDLPAAVCGKRGCKSRAVLCPDCLAAPNPADKLCHRGYGLGTRVYL